jgi:DNA polymerase-3 subunit gamma/tau
LREALNNYGLQTQIIVNEAAIKKFAYTPQEKYKKLLKKNPLLEKLKNTFKLDV